MKATETRDRLVAFLYLLMRDHVPSGRLESVMSNLDNGKGSCFRLSNGYLAAHAGDVARRLKGRRR